MKLALRELRRRPGRFVVAALVLTAIALLLMFLGALLDGLIGSSTGAYRAQQADAIVYSTSANRSLARSRITPQIREQVSHVPGVEEAGALGSIQLGARPGDQPQTRDLMATVLFGYELAPRGLPTEAPRDGAVIADATLRADGVEEGDVLLLGPQRVRVEVIGFVDDTGYAGQASLWGSMTTWREVEEATRPGQIAADTVRALVIRTGDDRDLHPVLAAIDEATGGATETLPFATAIDSLPGVAQQTATFNQIIGVTTVVALIVVALFFALITVERTGLYGILKALGASGWTLFAGVLAQAIVVTLAASLVGVVGSILLDSVISPGSIPFEVTPRRLTTSVALLLLAATLGCTLSLRRVLRIDPASAIGGSS